MSQFSEFITESVLQNWFSASTMADSQLSAVIQHGQFQRKQPTFKEVSLQLFRVENPYHCYNQRLLTESMLYPPHIGINTLNHIIRLLNAHPKFCLEVGSFIGSSAVLLGNFLKMSNGTLICIDTWCGDINMWLMDNFAQTMGKADGNPDIFDRFMSNMIKNSLTDTVIPFRVSSIVAARTLKVLNYEIDLIYLDSAHECGETFMELSLFHDILKNGGVMFGDDYAGFPAVKHDLDLFCRLHHYELLFTGDGDTWMIQKNAGEV